MNGTDEPGTCRIELLDRKGQVKEDLGTEWLQPGKEGIALMCFLLKHHYGVEATDSGHRDKAETDIRRHNGGNLPYAGTYRLTEQSTGDVQFIGVG